MLHKQNLRDKFVGNLIDYLNHLNAHVLYKGVLKKLNIHTYMQHMRNVQP